MKKFTTLKNSPIRKINEEIAVKANEIPKYPLGAINPNENTDVIVGEEGSQVVLFFSKLFESKEMAHIFHLQYSGENSNVIHNVLDEYYKEVPELIDKLIETYQGQYGIIDGYEIIDTKTTRSSDPITYFEELGEYIKNSKQCIDSTDTHLHSIIDDIMIHIYKSLYKMKFLK